MTDDVEDYKKILETAPNDGTELDVMLLEYLIELSEITRMQAEGEKSATRTRFDAIKKLEESGNEWHGGQFITSNDKRLNQLYARIICMEEKDYDPETVTNHIDELRNYIDTIIISGEWIATKEDCVRPNLIVTANTLGETCRLARQPELAELGDKILKSIESESGRKTLRERPITSYAGKLSECLREKLGDLSKYSGVKFNQPYKLDRHIDDYLIQVNEALEKTEHQHSLKKIASAWKDQYKSSYFSDKKFVEFSSSAPDTAEQLNAWIDGLVKTVETSSAINARFSIFHPSGKGRWDALGKVIGDQSKLEDLKSKVIDERKKMNGANKARKLLIDKLRIHGQELLNQERATPKHT